MSGRRYILGKVLFLTLISVAALLGKGVFADYFPNEFNVTYWNGTAKETINTTKDLGYINWDNITFYWINATLSREANWTLVLCNDTYKEGIPSYNWTLGNETANLNNTSEIVIDLTNLVNGYYWINLTVDRTDVGNATILKFTLDREKPTITYELKLENGSDYNPNTWTNQSVWINITASDNYELANVTLEINGTIIKYNNTANKTNYINFLIPWNGTHIINLTITDKAGNINDSVRNIVVKIDKINPTIDTENISVVSPSGYVFGNWTNQSVVIKVRVNDTLSGIRDVLLVNANNSSEVFTVCDYNNTEDNWTVYTCNLIAQDGEIKVYNFAVKVIDNASNEDISPTNYTVKIDKKPPLLEIVYPKESRVYFVNETWTNLPSNITVRISEEGSGINWSATYLVLAVYNFTDLMEGSNNESIIYINNYKKNDTELIVNVTEVLNNYTKIYGESIYVFHEIITKDVAGNENSTFTEVRGDPKEPILTIIYDKTPPKITVINVSKEDGLEANYINEKYYINTTNTTIYVNITDNDPLSAYYGFNVTVYVNGTKLETTNFVNTTYPTYFVTYPIKLNNLEDGEYNLTVKVEDPAGNINNTFKLTLVVDTISPKILYARVVSPREVELFIDEKTGIEDVLYKNIVSSVHDVNITHVSIEGNKIILTVNVTPLVGDTLVVDMKDFAGNSNRTVSVIENAADAVYILYNTSDWHYVAFEKPIDTSYDIFQDALTGELGLTSGGTVLMYKGDIGKTNPWIYASDKLKNGEGYGYGYAIKPDYQGKEYVLLPVKFKQTTDKTYITLEPGWNLVEITPLNKTAINETVGYIILDWTNFRHITDAYYADPYERIVKVPMLMEISINNTTIPVNVLMVTPNTFKLGFAVWVWTEIKRYIPLELPNTP